MAKRISSASNKSTMPVGSTRLVARELVERLDVGEAPVELGHELDVLTHARHLGRHLAGPVGVVPEVGRARLLLELCESGARLVDAQVLVGVGDAPREITQLLRRIAHTKSAPVTELVLLAAAAEARLVASGGLLGADRLLLDRLGGDGLGVGWLEAVV